MSSENEPKPARILTGPVLFLVVLLVACLLVSACALSFWWLNLQKETSSNPQQDNTVMVLPTESLLDTMPTDHYSIVLPMILSGPVSVSRSVPASEQVWIVTKIKYLKYELDGQRYDLATFRRVDNQDTSKGYCINRGWEVPEVGTEYLLTTEGIFVPVRESKDDPLQRFSKIQ